MRWIKRHLPRLGMTYHQPSKWTRDWPASYTVQQPPRKLAKEDRP